LKKYLLIPVILFCFSISHAQFIKERSIEASVGYGFSFPYDGVSVFSAGFYMQGEYVMTVSKWLDLRPYAGFIFSSSSGRDKNESKTNAFLFGGKFRLTAPIPYFAPYIELGLGGSIGEFETITSTYNIQDKGFIFHLPFTIGAQLGRKKQTGIEFTYYFQDSVKQFAGAFALGFSFPLDRNNND